MSEQQQDHAYEQEHDQDDQFDPQQGEEQYEEGQDQEGFQEGDDNDQGDIDYEQYDPIHQQQQHHQQEGEFEVDGEEEPEGDHDKSHSQEIDNSQSIPTSSLQQPSGIPIVSPLATRSQIIFHPGTHSIVSGVLTHSRVGTVPYTNTEVKMEPYERTVIEYEPQERTVTVMVPVEKKITDYRPVAQTVVVGSQIRPATVVSPLIQSTLRVVPVAFAPQTTTTTAATFTQKPTLYQSQIVTKPFIPTVKTTSFVAPPAPAQVQVQAPAKVASAGLNASVLSVSSPKSVSSIPPKVVSHQQTGSVFFRPQLQPQVTQFVKPQGFSLASPTFQTIPSGTLRSTIVNPGSFVSRPPVQFLQQTLPQRHSFSHSLISQPTFPFQTIKRQAVVAPPAQQKQ